MYVAYCIGPVSANAAAGSLDHHNGIDPFSSSYWEPKVLVPPAVEVHNAPAMAPPPAPTDAFQAISTQAAQAKPGRGRKLQAANLSPEMVQLLKDLVVSNPSLTKAGTVDLFHSQHSTSGCTRAQIQKSLASIAERSGKVWKLKEPIAA
jgi:chromatin assembly factor 1 subunit A